MERARYGDDSGPGSEPGVLSITLGVKLYRAAVN